MATATRRRRPSGTSSHPDPCPPRLFSEPSGPETEFCHFPLALAVGMRCAGGAGWLHSAHSKEGSPSTQQPGASTVLPSRLFAPRAHHRFCACALLCWREGLAVLVFTLWTCPMEESWFITPPPCFTAGGLTTIKVETSPMENLLIEHPSMSVYAVHNSCPGLSEATCGTDELHNPSSPRARKSCL